MCTEKHPKGRYNVRRKLQKAIQNTKQTGGTFLIVLALLIGFSGTFVLADVCGEQLRSAKIQKGIAEEVLRFHVRANSDSQEDQRVKMQVKEAVVSFLQPLLETSDSLEETKERVKSHLDQVEALAVETLASAGCDYGVRVRLGTSEFPEKTYGDCCFPAGPYDALIVELGEAKGENWWCMLYPGLCFFRETCGVVTDEGKEKLKSVLTEEEFTWVTDPKRVRIGFRWF